MKNLKIMSALFLISCGTLFMGSCRREEPAPNNQAYMQNAMGNLSFKAITPNDMVIPDVKITLKHHVPDNHQDTWTLQRTTNNAGIADFGALAPGQYDYTAEKNTHGHIELRQGIAQVTSNQSTTVLITFSQQ